MPLPTVLSLSADEATVMAAVLPVSDFSGGAGKFLVMCTKRGWIKKTKLDAFAALGGKKRGLTAISLEEEDELKWASICDSYDKEGGVPSVAAEGLGCPREEFGTGKT